MFRIIAWLIVAKDVISWSILIALALYGIPLFIDSMASLGANLGFWSLS